MAEEPASAARPAGSRAGGPGDPESLTGLISGRTFMSREVQYIVVDGLAVYEGCIVLGSAEELARSSQASGPQKGQEGPATAAGPVTVGEPWPGGRVPVRIDPSLPNKTRVQDAVARWNARVSLPRFVEIPDAELSDYRNYLEIVRSSGVMSHVGMRGGPQQLHLADGAGTGSVIHQLGHVAGLWHEHSREDRDEYVTVHWENIQPGREHFFSQHVTDGDDVGPYDYASIMHWGRYAFSKKGEPTMTPRQPGVTIGQRERLSSGDILAVDTIYPISLLFSASVRTLRSKVEQSGLITASALAVGLQSLHPEYVGKRFGIARLRPDEGERQTVDQWLRRVADLYDPDAVAVTRHSVIDGELTLLGLATLDRTLAGDLTDADILEDLRQQVDIQPSAPSDAATAEVLIDFEPDRPGARHVTEEDDKLGIKDDVHTLCRIIASHRTKPPLAIGLFGDWGTGKTFFMRLMQARLAELQSEARHALDAGGDSPYVERIEQVTFNAWHYVDGNLWASLITRILDVLVTDDQLSERSREEIQENLSTARQALLGADISLEKTQGELTEIRQRHEQLQSAIQTLESPGTSIKDAFRSLSEAEQEIARALPEHQQDIPDDLKAFEDDPTISDLRDLISDTRSTLGLLHRVLRGTSRPARVAFAAAAVGAIAGLALLAGQVIDAGLLMFAVSTVTGGVAWLRAIGPSVARTLDSAAKAERVLQVLERRLTDLETHDRVLQKRATARQSEVETAKRNLEDVRFESLMRQHIRKRVAEGVYHEELGLISLIRQDLERLSELFSPPEEEDRPGRPRLSDIDRIVLYIDDLDRCPPERVVEVLQAVHLLLAFPLFVVVVGVDSRWLLSALQRHYRQALHTEGDDGQLQEWEATPSDYLEKIFQLPLALSPMTDDGYRRLVAHLAQVPATQLANLHPSGTDTAGRSRQDGDGDAGDDADGQGGEEEDRGRSTPVRPDIVRDFEVPGTPLALRFSHDGRRLLVATDAGLWQWERGSTGLRQLWAEPVTHFAFSPDSSQVAWASETDIHMADIVNGGAMKPCTSGMAVSGLAVGTRFGEAAVCYEDGSVAMLSLEEQTLKRGAPAHVAGARHVVLAEVEPEHQRRLLVLDDKATLHGLRSTLEPPSLEELYAIEAVDSFAVSNDGTGLYTTTGHTIRRHQLADGRVEWDLDVADAAPPLRLSSLAAAGPGLHDARAIPYRWDGSEQAPTPLAVTEPMAEWILGPHPGLYVGQVEDSAVVVTAHGAGVHYRVDGVPIAVAQASPSGALLATLGGGSCRLWRLAAVPVDEAPSQLDLTTEEFNFLAELRPLVPTARAAKRLVNIYRLIRASPSGRQRLHDPATEDYKVVLVLLALVVGWPHLASHVLTRLASGADTTWPAFLDAVKKDVAVGRLTERGGHGAGRFEADAGEALGHLQDLSADAPRDLKRYTDWASDVGRFLVATRTTLVPDGATRVPEGVPPTASSTPAPRPEGRGGATRTGPLTGSEVWDIMWDGDL